jgi:hypothetical protein
LGLILVFSGLIYAVYLERTEVIGPTLIPEEFAGLPLTAELSGQSVIAELAWMHGQGFDLNKGSVGFYGRDDEITLYVAGTPFSFMAGRLLTAMRDKIAAEDSPFVPIGEHEIEGHKVYELEGMGKKHFYFRSRELIVWLAVDPAIASLVLQQVLEFYP